MRRVRHVVTAVLLFTAAACSGAGSAGGGTTPPPTGTAPSTSTAPSTTTEAPQSPAGSPSAGNAGDCPDGKYVLTKFEGTGLSTTKITATGSDVTISFTDGSYRLAGTGKPYVMKGENAGETAQLSIKGTLDGTYSSSGSTLTAEPGRGSGDVSLKAGGESRSVKIDQLGKTVAPHGTATVACDGDGATITMPTIALTLRQR